MKHFEGRVAAITGAASGMGRALALQLAQRGCDLALSDIDAAGLDASAALARQHGVRVTTQPLDVSDRLAVEQWAAGVVAQHGRVNLIFNNAGVALSSSMEGVDYADFEWIMGINFWGVVHGSKAFLPYLKAAGEGHIVNTSSLFGLCAQPAMGAYNASKFAVRGFTESLRQELDLAGGAVSATCVHPGGIKTNIAKAGRVSDNLQGLIGVDAEAGRQRFERLFITTADRAAHEILRGVQRNARRVLVGPDAKWLDRLVRLLPGAYQWWVVWATRRLMRR